MIQVLLTGPVFGIASYIRIRKGGPFPPKLQRYRRMLIAQFFFLLITVLAAREERVSLISGPIPGFAAWLIAFAMLTLFVFRTRRALPKLSRERLDRIRFILPEDPSQMPYWVGISAMAGIAEECAYRGLAFRFLSANNSSLVLALTLCIVSFAVAHMAQGWRGVVGTAIVAAIMHMVVFLTGSLYLPIVAHAIYDLIVGTVAMPVLSRTTPAPITPQEA